MVEDESEGAQGPGSRGPRVVTGDMKPKGRGPRVVTGAHVTPPPEYEPASDVPAEADTEAPAAASTPEAPAAPEAPKRPRMVTARKAPAAAPTAPTAPAADATVELPRPAAATRSIPTQARQTGAPPAPPAPPARPAPPKPEKPAKAPRPARPRSPLAAIAFGLALVSLVLFAIPAIPALLVARRAKRATGGSGLVTGARVIAIFSLVAWLVVAGIVIADAARPEGVDYAELLPGDCIDTPDGTEVHRLKIRACDKPHDAEVFAVVIHPAAPGEAFPGVDPLLQFAANACLGQPFTDYVGISRGQSSLTEFEIVPEQEAWDDGSRELVCAVDTADRSPLTASIKGSAR